LWDIIEHVEHDQRLLTAAVAHLAPGGHVLIAVPSNPREWRWDDDFYGHHRRYSQLGMMTLLASTGLTSIAFWDFTWPSFWLMRRLYTRIKRPPPIASPQQARTDISATVNAWHLPFVSSVLNHSAGVFWQVVYWIQFHFCRNQVARGHEMFVLARRAV
jgi:hypothetical protein